METSHGLGRETLIGGFMGFSFYAKWISYAFFILAAVVHFVYAVRTLRLGLVGHQADVLDKQQDKVPALLKMGAISSGLFALCLVVLIGVGVYHIHNLQVRTAGLFITIAGAFMMAAGFITHRLFPSQRQWALWQWVPPLLGFFFLIFHIRR